MKFAVIAFAVVLGIVRPFLSPHPVSFQGSYEAIAHMFVGGVIGGMDGDACALVIDDCDCHNSCRGRECDDWCAPAVSFPLRDQVATELLC